VDEAIMRELVNSDMYQKYKKFKLNLEVSKSPYKKFCPYPNCEAVIESKNTSATRMPCH
jgi:hypothetical protein